MISKNILLSLTREEAETLAEYIFNLAEEHDDSKEDQAFDRLVEVHFKVTKALEDNSPNSYFNWDDDEDSEWRAVKVELIRNKHEQGSD